MCVTAALCHSAPWKTSPIASLTHHLWLCVCLGILSFRYVQWDVRQRKWKQTKPFLSNTPVSRTMVQLQPAECRQHDSCRRPKSLTRQHSLISQSPTTEPYGRWAMPGLKKGWGGIWTMPVHSAATPIGTIPATRALAMTQSLVLSWKNKCFFNKQGRVYAVHTFSRRTLNSCCWCTVTCSARHFVAVGANASSLWTWHCCEKENISMQLM